MEAALVLVVAAGCPRPLPDLGSDATDDTGDADPSGDAASDVTGSSGSGSSGTGTSPPALGVPVLELGVSPVKRFDFGWAAVTGAAHYRLLESAAPGEPLVPLVEGLVGTSRSHTVPLHLRAEASYALQACDGAGACAESAPVHVTGSLVEAIGYFKASNADALSYFGDGVALSADGSTLVVGAPGERSAATGIDGDQADRSASFAGAVYVFVRDPMGQWSQRAYVKAANTDAGDHFGEAVALSLDGSTLAVGAPHEASAATGIDGDQADDSAPRAGAVYVLARDATGQWSHQAYVKATNADSDDYFGSSVALSADGSTLAVGAFAEASNATGIDGDQDDDSAPHAGAVYVLERDAADRWSQQAYVKAPDTDQGDRFGRTVALSGDGRTLAVGALYEDGSASGIDGEIDESLDGSGSVHVLERDEAGQWSHQAYVKASNPDANDFFGWSIALSGDGRTLAVGANGEDGSASGIDGEEASDTSPNAGAVYVLWRGGAGQWSHQAYVKASNPDTDDHFGHVVALSGDGNVLAIGAHDEDGSASGIGGGQADGTPEAGAAYVLLRDAMGRWSQRAYVKASNPDADDQFGNELALSGDGRTLAVGARVEDGSASGIGGNPADDSAQEAGAVYLY